MNSLHFGSGMILGNRLSAMVRTRAVGTAHNGLEWNQEISKDFSVDKTRRQATSLA
jgi:hypothetical protein